MRGAIQPIVAGLALLAASCGASFAQAGAGAPPPGATACSGCHAGADNAMPSLQGRSASDIEAAMAAYRAGAREATVMDRIAKGFSESETKDIASWLARTGGLK